jgi:hypothetical protein
MNATLIRTIKSQEPSVAYSAQIIQACLIAILVCIQVLPVLSANQILCYLMPLINALLADQLFRIASLAEQALAIVATQVLPSQTLPASPAKT